MKNSGEKKRGGRFRALLYSLAIWAFPLASIAYIAIFSVEVPLLVLSLIILTLLSKDRRRLLRAAANARLIAFGLLLLALVFRPLYYAAAVVLFMGFAGHVAAEVKAGVKKPLQSIGIPLILVLLTLIGFQPVSGFAGWAEAGMHLCRKVGVKPILPADTPSQPGVGFHDPFDFVVASGTAIMNCKEQVLLFGIDEKEPVITRAPGFIQRGWLDEERGLFGGGLYDENSIIFVDIATGELAHQLDAEAGMMVDVDVYGDDLYVLSEDGYINIVDREYNVVTKKIGALSAYSMRIMKDKLYLSQWATGVIVRMDAASLKVEKKRRLRTYVFGIVGNEQTNEVLAALPTKSKIAVIDPETLKIKRYLDAGYGVRDIQLDDAGKFVHSASYFDGTYVKTDYESGKIVESVYLGPYARGVYFDENSERTFAVTKCGLFEVNPSQ